MQGRLEMQEEQKYKSIQSAFLPPYMIADPGEILKETIKTVLVQVGTYINTTLHN